jgi:long-chain acyl-CoA synthetase
MEAERPWVKFYGAVPAALAYPDVTIYEALRRTIERRPNAVAYEFLGRTATYATLGRQIDDCATALRSLGVQTGDRLTIAMPNCPQGVTAFYATNKIGAVASMVHPLSPPEELELYLDLGRSRVALTLDSFYGAFAAARPKLPLSRIILARISDALGPLGRLGFRLTHGRKIAPVPADERVAWWREIVQPGLPAAPAVESDPDALAVILYSGGTTGQPKGIMLSNRNVIAEGMQVAAWGGLEERDSILAIMPIFHGFGLGVCVHAAFMGGAKSILVPQFNADTVARLIRRRRPSFIVGVPTLYDALIRNRVFRRSDLSCLRAAFCGADSLPRVVKEGFDRIVHERGGDVRLREGYGLTEAVTAIMAMPLDEYRENSIGVPFPDMLAKIVEPHTIEEVAHGEDGEICLHGPAVMLGYCEQAEESARVLRRHADGRNWLHTGDIGSRDADGFFYFKLRQKRMIKSSGMSVYPAHVEDVLYRHPDVLEACILGVPDRAQVERVKGFVVLEDPRRAGPEKERELIEHCRQRLIKWSCPREIEFRSELPKTRLGKIAFHTLREEEIAKTGSID